jgi:D-alanyl-D-alanine carboxypeptidase
MVMVRRLLLALLAALIVTPAAGKARDASFAAQADAYIRDQARSGAFSGSVLIAYDGHPLLRRAYGLANRELNVATHPDSEYAIASTTKTFTAVAILQLVEAGKLSLDDSVTKYLAEAPPSWKAITIAHLLSHESGLPEYSATTNSFRALMRTERTPREILGLIRERPLKFTPSSQYGYTNSDYVVLGLVIEAVSGVDYETYVSTRLLRPLKMSHTGFEHAQALLADRAAGYMKGEHGWENAFYIDPSMLFAAGSMYSNVDDLLTWDRAIYSDGLLSPSMRARMFTDRGHGYGLGFFIDAVDGLKYVGHGGSIPGFSSDFERFSDRPLSIVILSNSYLAPTERMSRELGRMFEKTCPKGLTKKGCGGRS